MSATESTTQSATEEDPKFSLDDLIAMAEQIKAKHQAENADSTGMVPFDLLCAMSAQILAAYIPEQKEALLERRYSHVEQTFACEMLSLNGLPSSLWISEERQRELYSGTEPLLFQKLPQGIFAHYAQLLGRRREDDDPMNWKASEFG